MDITYRNKNNLCQNRTPLNSFIPYVSFLQPCMERFIQVHQRPGRPHPYAEEQKINTSHSLSYQFVFIIHYFYKLLFTMLHLLICLENSHNSVKLEEKWIMTLPKPRRAKSTPWT